MSIFNGTQFSFDFNDLAMIARGKTDSTLCIVFTYKQGAVIPMKYDDETVRDEHYLRYVRLWEDQQISNEPKQTKAKERRGAGKGRQVAVAGD